jgi:hypothetical protein
MPQKNIHPGADRASHPATHRNKAKTHRKQSSAQSYQKIAKHYQLPKKPDAIVKQQKKEPATECPKAPHIAGPLIHTNHRQGKKTSQ